MTRRSRFPAANVEKNTTLCRKKVVYFFFPGASFAAPYFRHAQNPCTAAPPHLYWYNWRAYHRGDLPPEGCVEIQQHPASSPRGQDEMINAAPSVCAFCPFFRLVTSPVSAFRSVQHRWQPKLGTICHHTFDLTVSTVVLFDSMLLHDGDEMP